ncbi:MAG: hypothetical protein ACE15E_15760 [Acidobacteriota bacterium]
MIFALIRAEDQTPQEVFKAALLAMRQQISDLQERQELKLLLSEFFRRLNCLREIVKRGRRNQKRFKLIRLGRVMYADLRRLRI